MNTDDIIKLARDAAAKHGQELDESPEPEIVAFLVEFHTLVTQAERDACAIAAVIHSQYPITTDYDEGYDAGRRNAAAAIRARNAAMAAHSGWPVKGAPQSYTAEEAKLWTERFERALKGVE